MTVHKLSDYKRKKKVSKKVKGGKLHDLLNKKLIKTGVKQLEAYEKGIVKLLRYHYSAREIFLASMKDVANDDYFSIHIMFFTTAYLNVINRYDLPASDFKFVYSLLKYAI